MLTGTEMNAIVGAIGTVIRPVDVDGSDPAVVAAQAGPHYPWEREYDGVNTVNGNKLTSLPLVSWTARGGLPVAFTLSHNSENNYASVLSLKWTFSYDIGLTFDGSGNATVRWGDGRSYTFTKNVDGTFTPPVGIFDRLVAGSGFYDLTTKDQVKYHFTNPVSAGWVISTISDTLGSAVTVNHGTGNRVTSVVDPTNRTLTLGYDASNRLSTVTDPLSRVWTLQYDVTNGDLYKVIFPIVSGSTYNVQFGYNTALNGGHDITSLTNLRGKTSTFFYNANHSLAWEKNALLHQTIYNYSGGTTTITDPNGNATTHLYANGLLQRVTDPQGRYEGYLYDAYYNKTQVTDKRGHGWVFTYDTSNARPEARGNLLTAVNPLSQTTTYTYNTLNRLTSRKDGLNHTTTYGYDSVDRLVFVQDALLKYTYFGRDLVGQMTDVTDPLGHITTIGRDAHGYVNSVLDANNNQKTAIYNILGWKLSEKDALLQNTVTTRDNWGRATIVTAANNRATTTAYDANSNILSVTDPNAHADVFVYDELDRATSKTNGRGDVVSYTYDTPIYPDPGNYKGLLTSKLDGNSQRTRYSYTNRDELATSSYPDGTSETLGYNENGNVSSRLKPDGTTILYGYDFADRSTLIDYPTGTDTTYAYDAADRRTGMTDQAGPSVWTYDIADRLTGLSTPQGNITYGYDVADRRTSLLLTDTGSWTYGYDVGNRLTSQVNPSNETTTYLYDAADRLTQQKNASNLITKYGYDTVDRVTRVDWGPIENPSRNGWQTTSYDPAGNVSSRGDSDGSTTTYGYDGADQLTSEVRTAPYAYTNTYTYDGNANRLTKVTNGVTETYTYDAHDKLLTAGNKTYTYNLNGQCVKVVQNAQNTILWYNPDDTQAGIQFPSGVSHSFYYNGDGGRVYKQEGTAATSYVTDGTAVASPLIWDSAAVYTHGVSERRGTTTSYYQPDALGSSRALHDPSWLQTDAWRYDAFGMTLGRYGTTKTPFGFAGQWGYQSDTSGLQLLGHRYYDPSIGRFLTPDPAQDGDNWYAYCENNPLGNVDPEGLQGLEGVQRQLNSGVFGPAGNKAAAGIGIAILIYENLKNLPTITWPTWGTPPTISPPTRTAKGNVGDSRSNEELQRQIDLKNEEYNRGGLSPGRRREIEKDIENLEKAIRGNKKQSGDRGSRNNKEKKTPKKEKPVAEN